MGSDKTGKLTQNRLALAAQWTATGVAARDLLTLAALASRAEGNDPIDLAVLSAITDVPVSPIEKFTPFDPVSKRAEALVRDDQGRQFRVTKGAPQVIAGLCDSDDATSQIAGVVHGFAKHGYRSLGVVRTDDEGTWRLVGVLALADPPGMTRWPRSPRRVNWASKSRWSPVIRSPSDAK